MANTAEVGHDEAGSLGTTIEIKIKTMDSQTHTLRVDKQVPVPTLKEQIASITGVVTEQQRLICRGRVLKDDQLLSAYHVEDGHTLHLVARQPPSSARENLPGDSDFGVSSGGQSEYYQVAPGVVVEAFNMQGHGHGQGDRDFSDIGRIVSAVLGTIGITGPSSGGEGAGLREHLLGSLGRIPVAGEATDANRPQSDQPGTRNQSDRSRQRSAFGSGAAFSLGAGQAPVIPDALSTMSQYLTHMQREFSGNETDVGPASSMETEQADAGSLHSRNLQGLPTPASLAELLLSTRDFLDQHTGELILQLARQLEGQASVDDPEARSNTQSSAWRTGVLLQNLGAYLLELGRSIMTVRLGRVPSEAVVNAGPAVFISSSGPNPLMVQPFPFLPGASFGSPASGTPNGPSLSPGFGSGLLPRRIDIQIRRGSVARQPETDGSQQSLNQQESSAGGDNDAVNNQPTSANSSGPFPSGTSVRVLPFRTMVAAIPAVPDLNRAPSGNPPGLYQPLFGRLQSMASRNTGSRTGSQVSAEHQTTGLSSEHVSTPEATTQQPNIENPPVNGQSERPMSRTIDISIYSGGGIQSDHNPEGPPPDSVVQFLRDLFPGGELHMENLSPNGTTTAIPPEQENITGMAGAMPEADPRATDDAVFFSRMLQQIMPVISQLSQTDAEQPGGAGPSSTSVEDSEGGSSRRPADLKQDQPNSKRQKNE